MKDLYQSKKIPYVIAHRGANSFAPENSLKAFEVAMNMGCDGVEMDLRMTGSGDIIVFHDRNLLRMTGYRGSVYQLSTEKIRQHYLEGNPEHPIPLLQEALELLRDRLLIILDVKKELWKNNGLEEKLVKILQDFKLSENIIISSFNPFVLKRVAALAPQFNLGIIFRNRGYKFITNGTRLKSLHVRYQALSRRYVRQIQEKGYQIYAWTVDQLEAMKKTLELGIDGIITNRPENFFQLIREQSPLIEPEF